MEGEGLVHFIMRSVKDCRGLFMTLMSALSPRLLSLSCRNYQWTGCGDEHFHELVCEFLCTLLHCTGGDRGRFFESGSLQPAWRQTEVVYIWQQLLFCAVHYMCNNWLAQSIRILLCQWIILQHSSVQLSQEHMIKMTSSCTLDCASR